jgi:hypothetical protein
MRREQVKRRSKFGKERTLSIMKSLPKDQEVGLSERQTLTKRRTIVTLLNLSECSDERRE